MFKKLLNTPAEPALFVIRLTAAAMILPHGAQKLLGWFGGNGFEATMGFFTQQMGLPAPVALGVIATETLAMLALALGLGGRLMAAALTGIMIGAIATVHGQHGFFMNWFGQQSGEGIEYHLLVMGLSLALIWRGSGAWSLDRWLIKRLNSAPAQQGERTRELTHQPI